jgi:3-hydroxyisobutyrate dehydrogenase
MVTIGFIGLGDMGAPMAGHLADDGHDVTAFDVDDDALAAAADAGLTPAESSAAAAAGRDVVFLSLPDPPTVELVVDEIEDALDGGAVLVDTTTSTPKTTDAVAARLARRSVDVLGAPISGGKRGAREGTLSVMAGGDAAVYEACEPLFEAFATDRFHVGDAPGHGHAVKLLNNYLSYNSLLAASEAVILGANAGLDRRQLVEVFSASTGRNSATEEKIPEQVLSGDYDTGFPLSLTEKDLYLFTEFAEEQRTPVLLGYVTRLLVGYARAIEGDDGDMTRVYDFLETVMTR